MVGCVTLKVPRDVDQRLTVGTPLQRFTRPLRASASTGAHVNDTRLSAVASISGAGPDARARTRQAHRGPSGINRPRWVVVSAHASASDLKRAPFLGNGIEGVEEILGGATRRSRRMTIRVSPLAQGILASAPHDP
jgi:hypothetical protein